MQAGRGVLSCGSCRQRKLKCDRNEPCSNCVTRQVDCSYSFSSTARARPPVHSPLRRDATQARDLDGRLRHLEQLIGTMVAQKASSQAPATEMAPSIAPGGAGYGGPTVSGNGAAVGTTNHHPETVGPGDQERTPEEVKPGKFISNSGQVTYVSGVHWAAISEEVAKIKEHLDREASEDIGYVAGAPATRGPLLLEGAFSIPDLWEVLQDIPPKNIADRLVSRFFSSKEPWTVILHTPTFQEEYNKFWLDPQAVSLPWLSMLFGVLGSGTFLYLRGGDDLPGSLGNLHPPDVIDVFHLRGTQCLIMSRYTVAPTTYTMEALAFNVQHEFIRQKDAHMGLGVLSGVAIRLAMRMGYHRDPEQSSQITPFVGEMRRRVWASVLQLDAFTSFMLGLPAMIQEPQCDTKLPRNLLDEDFGPDSAELPPSRPETEMTPVLYIITKTRLLAVFRTIFNQVCLGRVDAYENIMAFDRRLRSIHSQTSPRLRIKNLTDAITEPPYLIIRRLNVEILFQKAVCVLHRHHMTKAYGDPAYNFSRSACVGAAMEILRYQASIHQEVQVGGLLYHERGFVTTLERNDYLLAGMVVCVELSSRGRGFESPPQQPPRPEDGYARFTNHDLVVALQRSRAFWADYREASAEAKHAFNLLSVMLDKVSTGSNAPVPEDGQYPNAEGDFSQYYDSGAVEGSEATAVNPELEGIGMLLDTPDVLDWNTWESFLQAPQGPL